MIRSDQFTLVKKLNWKRPTSVWTSLSFLFLIHRADRCNLNIMFMNNQATCLICRLNICQSILKSFKTLQSLTVQMSEQIILLNELICKILDFGLRASVTPSTLWAPVTLVTVQTVSIQSADLGRLGLMLWSMGQTELDIVLMSLVLHGEIVSHIVNHTDPGELSPASMIRHRRSRSRSSSYDSVSLRRHSCSTSRSRGKKKSHKKRKLFSTSRSSSRRYSSSSSRK